MKNWLGLDVRPSLTAEQADAFERRRTPIRTRALLSNVVTIGCFYLCYAVVDALLLGDVTVLSLWLRFGLLLPVLIGLVFFVIGKQPVHRKEWAVLAVCVLANAAWCVITINSASEAALYYYYAAVIFQLVITIGISAPLAPTLMASLAIFAVNYGAIQFVHGFFPAAVILHLAVYVPAMVLTLMASHQLEAERQRAFLRIHENELLKRELARRNGELEELSVTDPLTNLPNRRGTEARIASMRASIAPGDLDNCALLIIDIDHFKAFNDNYGHAAGDECLERVATAMRKELSGMMHLGRHGGEEFLALVPASGPGFARYMAERLRFAVWSLEIPHEYTGDEKLRVTVSIGIACGSVRNDEGLARLIDEADRALYVVKADGRNGWWIADNKLGIAAA